MNSLATITLRHLLDECSEDGQHAALCINTELSPIGGTGSPVNPAIYAGRKYQHDKRWESSDTDQPANIIVIDNPPSQANRLEAALDSHAETIGLPRLVLDLGGDKFGHLPPHLPRRISSLQFPHRNADAYLRDSLLNGNAFAKTEIGRRIFAATAIRAAALMDWFPQALLYGFWQSHLGRNRSQAKHARAWTSEIVGWHPANGDPEAPTPTRGTKGDPLNLQDTAKIDYDEDNLLAGWKYVEGTKSTKQRGKKRESMSNIGHGQVPFSNNELTPAAVSFKRITQATTCSFAQLRRVKLGDDYRPEQDAAARAVLVALGLYAHQAAFGRGFALRSGTDLVPGATSVRIHGGPELPGLPDTVVFLEEVITHARSVEVPLGGWNTDPVILHPNTGLTNAILGSWPELKDIHTDGSL